VFLASSAYLCFTAVLRITRLPLLAGRLWLSFHVLLHHSAVTLASIVCFVCTATAQHTRHCPQADHASALEQLSAAQQEAAAAHQEAAAAQAEAAAKAAALAELQKQAESSQRALAAERRQLSVLSKAQEALKQQLAEAQVRRVAGFSLLRYSVYLAEVPGPACCDAWFHLGRGGSTAC
jgi:septal ring factor EnvC (AmiA/AmiB activator)